MRMGRTLSNVMESHIESVFLNPDHFGVLITFGRAAAVTDEFKALVNESFFEVSTEYGIKRVETREYSFAPARLILDSVTVLPQRGDKIFEAGRTYKVTDPSGLPCYRYDENRTLMTVHTVLVTDA